MVLPRLRPLRLDRVRLGVRNEASEAGHNQCTLLRLPSAAPHRHRRRAVPGVTELLGGDRDRVGRGLARAIDALRLTTYAFSSRFGITHLSGRQIPIR